jgi:hypothetical protein
VDEKERLGADILRYFVDLVDNPEMLEKLQLYLGTNVEPIMIHSRIRDTTHHEEWFLDVLGRLIYELSNNGGIEVSNLSEIDIDTRIFEKKIILCSPRDFQDLDYESVASLHRNITSEDFFIKLAWRIGRRGKPGFLIDGFEEEHETWRIMAADPEDLPHLTRIKRRQRGFIG